MGKVKDIVMAMMETPVMTECPECGGAGQYEVDVPMPHNAGRDVGYIDSRWETCEVCEGAGEIEKACSDCGEVLSAWDINGNDAATVCLECRDQC